VPKNILVAVKRVIDYQAVIRVKADHSAVETQHVKMSMNPFDEIAVEEALRIKETGQAEEVVLVSIGCKLCQEVLRTGLAMGADRAILIETEADMEPLAVAKILQSIAAKEAPMLILLGKQAIDSDDNQTGQMLAGLLAWPQGTFVSKVDLQGEEVQVTREVDGGLEILKLQLPAVLTTDLRLNQPRYLSLPNIVKAKQKPIEVIDIASLAINVAPRLQLKQVAAPEKRKSGCTVKDSKELVHLLKHVAQVI
jgi:electron transfer flavoprotein beta subunit